MLNEITAFELEAKELCKIRQMWYEKRSAVRFDCMQEPPILLIVKSIAGVAVISS